MVTLSCAMREAAAKLDSAAGKQLIPRVLVGSGRESFGTVRVPLPKAAAQQVAQTLIT